MIPTAYTLPSRFPHKSISKALSPDLFLSQKPADEETVVLLDTFDEELRSSGRLLLESATGLILINPKSGTFFQQSGHAKFLCHTEITEGAVKQALKSVSDLRAFLPVVTLVLEKNIRLVLDDEGKTVVRLHCFSFKRKKNNGTQLALSQPLRGYVKEYAQLTHAMQSISREDHSIYEALSIKSTGFNPKPIITLKKSDPIKHTTNMIISTFIGVARQNETGIERDYDTEFLHDYRVSFRKVRSVLSLFKGVYSPTDTAHLKTEFADIMKVTGRLRDLDVYLLDKSNYFSLVPESTHEGLTLLFKAFEKERSVKHKLLCKSIKSTSYKKRVEKLANNFSQDNYHAGSQANIKSLEYACRVILKRYQKVCTIARSINEHTEDEVVHDLRIHCKKLRYLMEFFTPLFEKKSIRSLIKSLKLLQDNLGRFNDCSVQQESLRDFLTVNPYTGAQKINVAQSIGALTAMLNLQQQKERSLVMKNFAQFDSRTTRELFHQLFST
ncbi:MAG: CHAD domain-containing protein [Desulfobulbaceae bacterium]|nr:MAG: CHAD domain-containing protein [Desulfobulbaceae bacterium]